MFMTTACLFLIYSAAILLLHQSWSVYSNVCLSAYSTANIRAGTINFTLNMSYYCTQLKCLLEFSHASLMSS